MLIPFRFTLYAAAPTVSVNLTGVAATPAIGAGSVSLTFAVSGVAGSPAIGVGVFNSNFALSGVVAGAAVGVTRIDLTTTLGSVSASPGIGTGTVTIGAAADVFVNLVGVVAGPAIGTGTIEVVAEDVQYGATAGFRKRLKKRQPVLVKPRKVVPRSRYVRPDGVVAIPAIGQGEFSLTCLMPSGPLPLSVIGSPIITIRADLLDDEVFALMELAA